MVMHAPFRFAPVPRKVFFPDWASRVSHDVPFSDGISGEIRFSIEAVTPLLVGGPRRKPTQAQAGEVWPVRLPDGRYALPGSSLQGMVRSILEVASFANLAPFVRDRRYAVRDITGNKTGKALYSERLTIKKQDVIHPQSRAGWLVRRGARGAELIPCDHARVSIQQLAQIAKAAGRRDPTDVLTERREAPDRYAAFLGVPEEQILARRGALDVTLSIGEPADHRHQNGKIQIRYRLAGAGTATPCTLVLTGKPQTGTGGGHKKLDFAFFAPDRPRALDPGCERKEVPADVWRDFLLIHEPPVDSGQKTNPNWALWKPAFDRGEPVPVFWLADKDERVEALGTAFMFKLAMRLSTHDLLRNSSADHRLDAPPDLPTLLFGQVGSQGGAGLKRRASFDMATATLPAGQSLFRGEREAILLAPKPAFYPFYIRQPCHPQHRVPQDQTWAVYMEQKEGGPERQRPEAAGVKLYPAHGKGVHIPSPDSEVGNQVKNRLNALPAGTRFDGCRLRFHNLRPVELGALLWALTFGDPQGGKGYVHRLGMGKPLGFGMVRIRVKEAVLLPNGDVPEGGLYLEGLMQAFTDEMERFHRAAGGDAWAASPQVKALLKAASPTENNDLDLSYMSGPKAHSDARSKGWMLPPYVDTTGELPRTSVGPAFGTTQSGGLANQQPAGPAPEGQTKPDQRSQHFSMIAALEKAHAEKKAGWLETLKGYARQAERWAEAERDMLAQLYHQKLRRDVPSHLQRNLDQKLRLPT